jgi:hypothetical protein
MLGKAIAAIFVFNRFGTLAEAARFSRRESGLVNELLVFGLEALEV